MLENETKNWTEFGLELLVEMSRRGDIDPWDVDLVLVIDKFLNELGQGQEKQELKEAARIIFFVSVLLKIKSQTLYNQPIEQELEDPPFDDDLLDFQNIEFTELNNQQTDYQQILSPRSLDRVLVRNTKPLKPARGRKITLTQLIDIFKKNTETQSLKKRKSTKPLSPEFEEIALREDEEADILELAHDENLEQKIELLSQYILHNLQLEKQTSLSELQDSIGDWVDTFLSALFLSHAGKTEIWQSEIYDELWLKRIV